jgi:hypothetical protein
MPGPSLKAIYCERHHCAPEQFLSRVFRRCLYPHAIPAAYLLGWVQARLFDEDRRAIEQFGMSITFQQVRAVVEDLRYVNRTNQHWLRTGLRIRLSGRRLYELGERLTQTLNTPRPDRPTQDGLNP